MNYKHTQIGYLIIWVLIAILLYFGFILTKTGFDKTLIITMFFVSFILISLSSLTTETNFKELKVKFGYGIYRKTFQLKEIAKVKTVTNKWYYGWGIKVKLNPLTIIYNVSGFDAVEIETKTKQIFRIGTDEPKKLERAIQNGISK